VISIAVGLPQVGDDVESVVRAARDAEDAGAWGVWVFDNLQRLKRPELSVLEGWSLLGPLAAATSRVRLVSLVTRAGLRPPALVARMAAVVQAASDGRFVLGLGAGDAASRAEEERFGIQGVRGRSTADAVRSTGVEAEREARLRLIEGTVREVREPSAPLRPVVAPPPIWVGGTADALIDLALRVAADAWHGWGLEVDAFARRAAGLPSEVEKWWGGTFDPANAERQAEDLAAAGAAGITWMIPSARDERDRPKLLDLVRSWAS
jgi:alkanesulfonate monooxygenase SsuD/methylene tetrahydromethanopterin reductase-like flavin-dependent oxidoreductase (luciferase family)